jgi:RHS repeat-associated protein
LATCASASATWRPRWFTYDSLSRLLTATNPESGTLTYTYDVNSNVTSKKDARLVTTNYLYDNLNRLIQKSYTGDPSNTVAVKYLYDGLSTIGSVSCAPTGTPANPIGHRTSMCDAAGSETWSYPLILNTGWQTVDTRTTNGVTKTITTQNNQDGSVYSITYPSGRTVTNTPGGAGRPLAAVDATNNINYATNAKYAPFGGLATLTNGTSITVNNAYNSRLQPSSLSATAPTGPILSVSYDFHLGNGDNGNVYKIINGRDSTRTQNFTYDALNRIAEAWTSGPAWGERFTIDPWGNLTNRNPIPGQTNYEGLNAPALISNRLSGFGYDAAGNMTSNGGANYTYDAESRLLTAGGVTYTYDGDGNRVMKSSGTIYWGGALAESDLTGANWKEYIFFGGQRIARQDGSSSTTAHYFFANHLGSTSVVTNSTGAPPFDEDLDYYPYGGLASGTSSDHYMFDGKERDSESGLDNFGARYDASSLGRFMTPDWAAKPITVPYAVFGDPQTLNLYAFVENGPVNRADADGHFASGKGDFITGCDTGVITECSQATQQAAADAAKAQQQQTTQTTQAAQSSSWLHQLLKYFYAKKSNGKGGGVKLKGLVGKVEVELQNGKETKFTTEGKETSKIDHAGATVEIGPAKVGVARDVTQVVEVNGTPVNEPAKTAWVPGISMGKFEGSNAEIGVGLHFCVILCAGGQVGIQADKVITDFNDWFDSVMPPQEREMISAFTTH